MRLLVMGGGIFVGRAILTAAIARGHEVTVFNRGRTRAEYPPGVVFIAGDRDGDLAALRAGGWDAVIDTCGYLPRQVRSLLDALGSDPGHYTFVSSVTAYAGLADVGTREEAPLAAPPPGATDQVTPQTYGPLKAACEAEARRAPRRLIARPGIVVGPGDPTGRFTYWARRVARGGDLLAPGGPAEPLQVIDVRDLAAWLVARAEQGTTGVFNAVGPATLTWGEMLATCAGVAVAAPRITWVDGPFLQERGAGDWASVPLFLPPEKPEFRGMFRVDGAAALRLGLALRPLRDTVADLLDWTREPGAAAAAQPGLSAARESELLEAWRAARGAAPPRP